MSWRNGTFSAWGNPSAAGVLYRNHQTATHTNPQCSTLDYDEGSRRARCQATEGQCRCLTTDDLSVHQTARYEVFGGFYRLTFGDGTQLDFVFCVGVDGDELLTDGGDEAPWMSMRYRRVRDAT